jgi:hypothetical protein
MSQASAGSKRPDIIEGLQEASYFAVMILQKQNGVRRVLEAMAQRRKLQARFVEVEDFFEGLIRSEGEMEGQQALKALLEQIIPSWTTRVDI